MRRMIVILALSLTISACAPATTRVSEGEHGLKYRIVEIEGMPCIWVKYGFSETSHAGLSCDWSQWKGK